MSSAHTKAQRSWSWFSPSVRRLCERWRDDSFYGAAQHERTIFWESTLAKSFSSHTDANPLRSDSMSKLFCMEKSDLFLDGECCQDLLLRVSQSTHEKRVVTSVKANTWAGDYLPVCFTPWDANNKKEETKQLQPLDSPLAFVLGSPLTCQLNTTDISKIQFWGASRWRCLLAGHRINCSISVNVCIFKITFHP